MNENPSENIKALRCLNTIVKKLQHLMRIVMRYCKKKSQKYVLINRYVIHQNRYQSATLNENPEVKMQKAEKNCVKNV